MKNKKKKGRSPTNSKCHHLKDLHMETYHKVTKPENLKKSKTQHVQTALSKILTSDNQLWIPEGCETTYLECRKGTQTVVQNLFIWQNYQSKMKEKLKY